MSRTNRMITGQVLKPAQAGCTSEVYLVRDGIEQEIAKVWQHTIRNSQGAVRAVLLHGHRLGARPNCVGRGHWVVTDDGLRFLGVYSGLMDEHTEDVHLLKATLRDARDEILRLRVERDELRQQYLRFAIGNSSVIGAVPVSTEDTLGPETPEETAEVDELARELRESYTPSQSIGVQMLSIFGIMPYQAHRGDAGYDLWVSRPTVIEPGMFVDIHCDVAMQLPPDVWGLIIGRSSTIRKRGLLVVPGIIDSGFRGELFAGVWNLGTEPVEVSNGERLAQFIPMPLLSDGLELQQRSELDDHDRGVNGFGSTGQ